MRKYHRADRVRAVALRKESVDRNSRAASCQHRSHVALRKESVDRNSIFDVFLVCMKESLSARRAWIEILFRGYYTWIDGCRSPQGERG